MKKEIFWRLDSNGAFIMTNDAVLKIDRFRGTPKFYHNPTNSSLQRLIKISKTIGVEIDENVVTVCAFIKELNGAGNDTQRTRIPN